MEKKKPVLGNYFKLPNPGLRAYFQHTVVGNQDDYRPPFFKGKSREDIVSMWQKVFDTLGVKEKYPGLYDYELDMKSKIGPLSIQEPLKDRIEDIENYYTMVQNPGVPISEQAIRETIRFFKKGSSSIRLRSIPNTVAEMKLSTNSGTPDFTKRRVAIRDFLNAPFTSNGTVSYQGKYELGAVLGWRGQEGGPADDDVKQRVLFMMALGINVHELRWYQPAVAMIQAYGLIPAYVSMDAVDQEVTQLFDTKGPDDSVVCTDFTKFDQHFNSHMQMAAERVMRSLSTGSPEMEEWFKNIYPLKFNVPLICSEDLMYCGPHGMGSGSGGTNFDECMAHKCLQFEAALNDHQSLNPHSMAYGDDGILSYPGIKVENVIRTYESHGQEMNTTKQYVSKHDCVVLRRWHGDYYRVNGTMVGVYSTYRALGRLMGQERFYDPEFWGPIPVELRQLSILENCKWSPYFHEFIDFVMSGDKYRLGLEIPGFLDNIKDHAKKAIEVFDDFLGYTKTLQNRKDPTAGIENWEVVKYVKSKKN